MKGLVGNDERAPLPGLLVPLDRIEVDDDDRPAQRTGQAGHVSRSAARYAVSISSVSERNSGSDAAASQASVSSASRTRRPSSSPATSITASWLGARR